MIAKGIFNNLQNIVKCIEEDKSPSDYQFDF